jgi:twitching motility protein PilU
MESNMKLTDFFKSMKTEEASDLYLTTDSPPALRIYGTVKFLSETPLHVADIKEMAYSVMSADQIQQFEHSSEMNLAVSEEGTGRFRINIFMQKGSIALVVRNIHTVLPDIDALGLPPIVKELISEKRGLILFVGATGAGKSTSLAALINYRNEAQSGHIICIEDPIEFLHPHKKSLISQREVGIDTVSYAEALKNALRQAPDIILIGEIRARETMEQAIIFSETGHLCLSTLHANNANQALDRILNFFPEDKRPQLLLDLSFNLKAIIAQRLIPTLDGKRVAALEVMIGTPLILDYIRRGEISALKDLMEKSENLGMQSFDMALEKLYRQGKISLEEALNNADSRNNLRLKIETMGPITECPPKESGLNLLDK